MELEMHLRTLIRFDVLVNGGGAVTLQFQRSPFKPLTRTVFVPWNQIVVLPPVVMILSKEGESYKSNQPPSPAVGKHRISDVHYRIFICFVGWSDTYIYIYIYLFVLHVGSRYPLTYVTNVSINARTCSITTIPVSRKKE